MYTLLLFLHSAIRWVVLVTILYTLVRSYRGWLNNMPFTKSDNILRVTTLSVVHIQVCIGVALYATSPVIRFFYENFKHAVHDKDFRFFGMEHSLMMLIAAVLITIGSVRAKKKTADQQKFKTLAIYFTIALLIIVSSIPWPFLDMVANRPLFRAI